MATIPFIFPAVVSGYQDSGYPRHALVRVRGEFELKEVSTTDAPPALKIEDDLYRVIDGKLFLKYAPYSYPHDMHDRHAQHLDKAGTVKTIGDQFSPDVKCGIFYSLYSGLGYAPVGKPFTGFGQHVANYAKSLARHDHRQEVENRTRWQPDKKLREMQIDDETTRATLNAPMLRNWRWLSSDADKEVDHWRSIAQATFDNLVAIDGSIWFRAPEPRIKIDTGYLRHQGIHPHLLYQSQVHTKDYDDDGFLVMPEGSLIVNRTFFDLDQSDEAHEFIKCLKVACASRKLDIQIFDNDVLEKNTANLERMRIARIVMKAALWTYNELHENPEETKLPPTSSIASQFNRDIQELWNTLQESQDSDDNSGYLLPALSVISCSLQALEEATSSISDVHQKAKTILSYIDELHLKEDVLPVALPTKAPTNIISR
jgi:hypothetical protein